MGVTPQPVPGGSSRPTLPALDTGESLWGVSPGCTQGLYGAHESQSTCADRGGQSQGLEWVLPSFSEGRLTESHDRQRQ